jgi:dolichol-phosphate mannosyltransferase
VIYVLVPAHDEAQTVGLLLWKVRQVFTAFEREYQLLVVDDASADGTDEILAPYARALPLTLVTHERRRGYAHSLEELLRLAVARSDRPRRDAAVTIQADFSESPDELPEMIKRIESGADLVLADGRARPGIPAAERLARRLVPAAVRPFAKLTGTDAGVGTLRAYRLGTLARMLRSPAPLLHADGWAADLELLARATAVARRVDTVALTSPVPPRQRPVRLRPFRALLDVVRVARTLPAVAAPVEQEVETDAPRPPRRGRGRRGGRGRPARNAPSPSAPSPQPSPEPG